MTTFNNNSDNELSFGNFVRFDDVSVKEGGTSVVYNFPPPPPVAQFIRSSSHLSSFSSDSPKTVKAFHSPHLRSNLTRAHQDRDPFFSYELIETLGVGSMGSVVKVRRRGNTVGGSARKDIQDAVRRQKRNKEILSIPCFGTFFRLCVDGELKLAEAHANATIQKGFGRSLSAIFKPKGDAFVSAGESAPTIPESDSADSLTSTTVGSRQNTCYAMKSIHLNRITDKSFLNELRNEIGILKQLDHPHIVRANETYEHRNRIYIVMELCSGGDLYSRDPYTEEQAARIISSILSAIAYMHSKKILHRDLKYENVLFVNESPKAQIKLIDFGLSKVYGDNTELIGGVGTIYTMAPEVLKGNYTAKADVWSVGVLAFMLLSSQMPFYGRKKHHIVEQILSGQFDFRGRRWKRVSAQAKAFIEELLVLDVDERLDAQTALSATWLNRRFAATTRGPDAHEESMARHAMLRYAGYTKLKKMALMVVAHKSSTEEIGILRKMFQKYDKRRDGSIGFEDFCSALSEFGHSEEDLREMFAAVDLDGTGQIRYTEFLAATIEARGAISEERLAEAFDRLDTDDSGKISADNLVEILGQDFPREEIDEIIAEADLTKDNQISYAEFLALWEDKHEQERIEQLRLLGTEVLAGMKSDADINSFRERCSSVDLLRESQDDIESAAARASFLQSKRDNGKQVAFQAEITNIPFS